MPPPLLIAGAGPGGLVLALALHQRNIPCVVYESVSTLKPLGVGINLLPHSVRVLHQLGLQTALEESAILTGSLSYYNKLGQLIWSEPRGLAAGYAYPQYSIHRGQLQMLLLAAVKQRLGDHAVQTGLTLVDWRQADNALMARFRSADGTMHEVRGRGLVAADGIHSAARHILHPDEGPPIYAGRILWRAVTEGAPFLSGRSMIMAGHQHRKFVCYPISRAHELQGRARINWIAELTVPEPPRDRQDWNRVVGKDRFASAFVDWRFDWLDVPALIDGAQAIYEYPLVDRDPLPHWTQGLVTLLGDAAHPMYPIGSNGASQAILDAETLAEQLAATEEVATAFSQYEAIRRPATSKIVLLNRQNGPEQVMQLAEERAPNGFTNINDVIPHHELEDIANRYKQTAGFSVTQVNK